MEQSKDEVSGTSDSRIKYITSYAEEFISPLLEDEVDIQTKEDENGYLVVATPTKKDISTLIGKQGATVKSIKIIFGVLGYKLHRRVSFMVGENTNNTKV